MLCNIIVVLISRQFDQPHLGSSFDKIDQTVCTELAHDASPTIRAKKLCWFALSPIPIASRVASSAARPSDLPNNNDNVPKGVYLVGLRFVPD